MLRGLLGGFARGRRQTSAATLSLNFLAGLNDSRITYSGGANGTRVNSSGVIVAATTPRFDYDPVTLAAKGLLVEEQRINLLIRSEDFTNASWADSGVPGGAPTRTSNTNTAPSGSVTADTITDADAGNRVGIAQSTVVPNDSLTRVLSLFVLKTSGATSFPGVQIQYTGGTSITAAITVNTNTGTLTDRATFSPAAKGIEDFGTYWRVWVSFANNTSGNTNCVGYLFPAVNTNASGTWDATTTGSAVIWGAQLETGTFPTSYIQTTSAQVTRTADSAVMTGTNFSSWYNQTEGTFVATGMPNRPFGGSIGGQILSAAADGSNRLWIAQSTTTNALNTTVQVGGAAQASIETGGASAGLTDMRAASAYAANNFAASLNGATPGTDVSGSVPTCNALYIGGSFTGSAAGNWNGHIRSIVFYPSARPGSLQALSS